MKGVTHKGTYGTSWGGYVLIEVDDPEAFGRYQAFHLQNYAHVVNITFEPAWRTSPVSDDCRSHRRLFCPRNTRKRA